MSKKIRLLGIAPYEGLKQLMEEYACQRKDLDFVSLLGSMEEGAALAKEYYSDFDIIISRANTADLIKKSVPIPVIDLGIGYYDILRCLKTAEATHTKFALLGHPSLTKAAQTLRSLLKAEFPVFSISDTATALHTLHTLSAQNYQTVICDTVAYEAARKAGLTPILLTSSAESLETAVNHALYLWEISQKSVVTLSMLKETLKTGFGNYLLLNENGTLLYSTLQGNFLQAIQTQLQKEVPSCLSKERRSFFITAANKLYAVSSRFVDTAPESYLIFCLTPSKLPVNHSKYGISILNREDTQNTLTTSICNTGSHAKKLRKDAKSMKKFSPNLMLTGEYGTEEDCLAYLYYIESKLHNHPLYKINCDLLNEKNWNFLINSFHSPFTDNDNTIYISNLQKLSAEKQKWLLSVILDTNAHVRNRFIFSCCKEYKKPAPAVALEYANALDCIVIPVAPLREQKTDLPSMCALYINTLNEAFGKQLIALDDDAICALTEYDYPGNHAQLKRILKQAVIKTNSLYLSNSVIQDILVQERQLFPARIDTASSSCIQLDCNLSLDEINRCVIQQVLKNCNGNQSVAARKLGISRTTLWRSLNRG